MATKLNKSASNEEMKKRLEELERENESLKSNENSTAIRLDEYIETMSLYPGKLTLSTEPLGRGRPFSFNGFGETKRILYNDLASILENYRSFLEGGLFYILDKRVIKKHGLDDTYARILNKDMILKVISTDPKVAVKLYNSTTDQQREIIEGMLVQELKNGNPDLNIIAQISKLANKDLIQIAEDAKQLDQVPVTA
jgi:hypothetical protein